MKFVNTYKDLVRRLHIYLDAILIPCTSYLSINLIPPSQLNEMLTQVKEAVLKMKPDYALVIKVLHLYYDIKLVAFGTDENPDLTVQFPGFVHPYNLSPLTLCQIEFVPIPIK